MDLSPSQYETVSQLRAAMRTDAITEYHGIIVGVKIDGQDIGDDTPRAVSGSITYSVGLFASGASAPDQSQLNDLVPDSRIGDNLRVIGPKRMSPCDLIVVRAGGQSRIYFFPRIPERSDPYSCAGNPVLEGV